MITTHREPSREGSTCPWTITVRSLIIRTIHNRPAETDSPEHEEPTANRREQWMLDHVDSAPPLTQTQRDRLAAILGSTAQRQAA